MASSSAPKVLTFKASAAIEAYRAVKFGADDQHVTKSSAATDKNFGIAQNACTAAEDACEVAINGGGAKASLGGTVARGDYLTSDANGQLVATTTEGDNVIAQAMESGVLNDVIGVEVTSFNH